MGIVSWLVWGLFIGLVARAILPGRQAIGCLWTAGLGIAGSLIGGIVATKVLHIGRVGDFNLGSFLIAIATSVLLLVIWEQYERRRPSRDPGA